ncbi:YpoC family protein [Sporosarcina cyprini]|uniref:YpoC family protein n=1 Tax=Sporosarcina cyprini TaxID=2910523 RepID=UPI00300CDEC6
MNDNAEAAKSKVDNAMKTWSSLQETIHQGRAEKNPSVGQWMRQAIQLYEEMLAVYCDAVDERSAIEPMNGKERIDFVKLKLRSPQAFQQLQALFKEAAKKAASLYARSKRSETI